MGNYYENLEEKRKQYFSVLSKEFPAQNENPNELPDGLVILGGGEWNLINLL